MSYTSAIYLAIFLPVTLIAYQLTPQKHRGKVLIGASAVFFWSLSKWLIVYLAGAILVTHYTAIGIEKAREAAFDATPDEIKLRQEKSKKILSLGIFLVLGTLVVLKYTNFNLMNITHLLRAFGSSVVYKPHKILIPIGISFYTLESIGYLLDVHWGKVKAIQSLEKTTLFLGFFPKLMEGPICQYSDLEGTLFKNEPLQFENLKRGMLRIFWGMFKKIVIADRLAIIVNSIYANFAGYHGGMILVAAVGYTLQLYMEFSGVMDIVIGTAELFGIKMPENFRQPFFAKNATEFWQRWHISLGKWLKSYVFYPVSVSKTVKKWNQFGRKKIGKFWTRVGTSALALFPVWLINGFWHGPFWNYIFYGMYYFTLLLIEVSIEPTWKKWMKKIHVDMKAGWYRAGQSIKLLCIVFTGEMFFRAPGLRAGFTMFKNLFKDFSLTPIFDGTLEHYGLERMDLYVAFWGIVIVFIFDLLKEKNKLNYEEFNKLALPVRWSAYYALILAVIILGAYGEGYQAIDLIYAGF